jgi:hypothetical protein
VQSSCIGRPQPEASLAAIRQPSANAQPPAPRTSLDPPVLDGTTNTPAVRPGAPSYYHSGPAQAADVAQTSAQTRLPTPSLEQHWATTIHPPRPSINDYDNAHAVSSWRPLHDLPVEGGTGRGAPVVTGHELSCGHQFQAPSVLSSPSPPPQNVAFGDQQDAPAVTSGKGLLLLLLLLLLAPAARLLLINLSAAWALPSKHACFRRIACVSLYLRPLGLYGCAFAGVGSITLNPRQLPLSVEASNPPQSGVTRRQSFLPAAHAGARISLGGLQQPARLPPSAHALPQVAASQPWTVEGAGASKAQQGASPYKADSDRRPLVRALITFPASTELRLAQWSIMQWKPHATHE